VIKPADCWRKRVLMKYLELVEQAIEVLNPSITCKETLNSEISKCIDAVRMASVVFDEHMKEVPHNRNDIEELVKREMLQYCFESACNEGINVKDMDESLQQRYVMFLLRRIRNIDWPNSSDLRDCEYDNMRDLIIRSFPYVFD